jgi:hypothetical protein
MTSESAVLNTLQGIKKQSILGSWVSRIMSDTMQKQTVVHPCIINGQHTLIHERGLQAKDPLGYQHILEFAKNNGFIVKEDKRSDFLEGVKRVKNQRRANVVTVMALTATLLSTNVAASSSDNGDGAHAAHAADAAAYTDVIDGFDFDMDAYSTQEEMITAMFGWINNHSSFDHDVTNMPDIVKVSALQMAEVAFGGELPQAVDPEKLRIYGLYNFNEEAVYILDSLDLESEKGKGILLHELVHFLQYQYDQDEDVKCKNELESLAYVLEAKFLQSHDHEHNINMDHINRVSQCT